MQKILIQEIRAQIKINNKKQLDNSAEDEHVLIKQKDSNSDQSA